MARNSEIRDSATTSCGTTPATVSSFLKKAVLAVCSAHAAVIMAATPSLAAHTVGPKRPLVIPVSEVIGGTGVANNAKTNPKGGYYSVFDNVTEFKYPSTHGNQLGSTAMVNDHTYWDSIPGGIDHTHAPHPDPGGGKVLWWPVPGEWVSYQFNVTAPVTYTVLYRFASGWGSSRPVVMHMTIDGVTSGPITMAPDDLALWKDKQYCAGGWWGHTVVSGTSKVGWDLPAGPHVLKVYIDSFPEKPNDHGWIWIHYFKIMAGGNSATTRSKVRGESKPRDSAAAQAQANRRKQTEALEPFRAAIDAARESASKGDFPGAFNRVSGEIDKAYNDDAKSLLKGIARGYKSAADLKQSALAGIKAGGRGVVSLYVMGRNVRARVLQANEHTVSVAVLRGGPTMDISWGKLGPGGLANIALKLQAPSDRQDEGTVERMRGEYEAALNLLAYTTDEK